MLRHYMSCALVELIKVVGSLDIFGDVARLLQVRVRVRGRVRGWGRECVCVPWAGEGHGPLAPTRLQMLNAFITQTSSVPVMRCTRHHETVLLDDGRCADELDQGAHQALIMMTREATPIP